MFNMLYFNKFYWWMCSLVCTYTNARQHIGHAIQIRQWRGIYSGTFEERTIWEQRFCPLFGGFPSLGGSRFYCFFIAYTTTGDNFGLNPIYNKAFVKVVGGEDQ